MNYFYRDLPRLETERLVLRKAVPGDAQDIFAYASDPEVTHYLRWGPHRSLADTEAYLQEMLEEYTQGRDGSWMIELKSSHTVIGSIHLMELDLEACQAQVGFTLAKANWNQGYASEALRRVLELAFGGLALERVEAWPIAENLAARRVLEKAGLHLEGEPQRELQKGTLWDFCLYAIERSKFNAKTRSR